MGDSAEKGGPFLKIRWWIARNINLCLTSEPKEGEGTSAANLDEVRLQYEDRAKMEVKGIVKSQKSRLGVVKEGSFIFLVV